MSTEPTSVGDSKLFNCSVRSIIALEIATTICVMHLIGLDVKEPLYTLGGMVVGFYMGQNGKRNEKTNSLPKPAA